jgi:hypothetical protein
MVVDWFKAYGRGDDARETTIAQIAGYEKLLADSAATATTRMNR